jgi:arylsulfatase A-like enzyme
MTARITRRSAVGGAAGAILSDRFLPEAAFAQPTTTALPQPNIIVILADDLGYADVSAYMSNRFPTPNIDRLGKDGVRFTNGYSTAPVCGPSRAGLMTGRYQQRFGFEYNNGPAKRDLREGFGLSTGELTIADLLKRNGYHTGAVGKWHLGSQEQFYPTNRGFDEFVGFLPGETSYIDPRQPGVQLSFGPLGNGLLTRNPRIAQSFYRHPLNNIVEGPGRTVINNEDVYLTDYFADRASEFVARNAKTGTPYFLYTAFNAVHSPHMVTAEYYARFAHIDDHQTRVYAAMIAALDDAVGKILDTVDATGQAGNTMIYFGSDHGCAMYFPGLCSCLPLRGGKLSHYEGGPRIPLMFRWPARIAAGQVYQEPVSLLDVLPTSLMAAGGTLPADRVYDGADLLPYLTGAKTGGPHDALFWRREPLFSMRQGDWKLWRSVDTTGVYGDYTLLFNLRSDPNETVNLAPGAPEKVRELEALIQAWDAGMINPKWPSKRPVTYNVCGREFTLPV